MPLRTELALRLPNSPGALASVCRLLSDERVNILAIAVDSAGLLRMVVDNPVRAIGTLRENHRQVTDRPVIVASMSNAPGTLARVLQSVADAGFNLEYAYGSVAETAASTIVVLGMEDAERAATAAGL